MSEEKSKGLGFWTVLTIAIIAPQAILAMATVFTAISDQPSPTSRFMSGTTKDTINWTKSNLPKRGKKR